MGFSQLQRARRQSEPLRQVIRCRCWAWLWGNWVVVMNDLQFSFDLLNSCCYLAYMYLKSIKLPKMRHFLTLLI